MGLEYFTHHPAVCTSWHEKGKKHTTVHCSGPALHTLDHQIRRFDRCVCSSSAKLTVKEQHNDYSDSGWTAWSEIASESNMNSQTTIKERTLSQFNKHI